MAGITRHINKRTGAIYVYSVESYWDKEKKAPRNKQICLGRLNEDTGEIIPSNRKKRTTKNTVTEVKAAEPGITASAKVLGPFLLLDSVAKGIGFLDIINKCFGSRSNEVASMVYFLVHKGLPLSRIEGWSDSNEHPAGNRITSQHVSKLLLYIDEAARERFFSLWMKKLAEKECFCYDITSISSYSDGNEYIRWGYNRDHENLPQVNLAMLFGQTSRLPAYFRSLPGFISDVATLKTTMKSLDFLGQKKLTFVIDRGFYSETNVDALFDLKYHFILTTPTTRVWVREIIDAYRNLIMSPTCYREQVGGDALFMTTHLHKWKGRRCYIHIYHNAANAAADYDGFTKKLLAYKRELELGNLDKRNQKAYDRYFFIKNTPKRGLKVSFNEKAIEEHRDKYAGFFCILTTAKMDPQEALDIYRDKDVVENCFDDLKNSLDMKRLRIHSSQAMASRLFIQFLSLILVSKLRSIIKANDTLSSMTMREVLEAMETVVRITYARHYGKVITELGPLQRNIMDALGFSLPT